MSEIKPLLRQMIDNNEPYWRTRTIRGAHNLLDEYEAKAKLADDIITAWKTGDFDFTEGEGNLPDHGIAPTPNYHMFDFGQYVDSLLDEYESGESDESTM